MPCSKVPASVTDNSAAAHGAVLGTEHLGQLRRRPDVVGALRALGVGVQRGREPALRRLQLTEQEVGDALGGPDADVGPPLGVHAEQQRVVVEHLLEVRHHPVAVDGVAREPAGRAGRGCRRGPSPPGSRRASPARRAASRNSSTIDGGNFGAPPNPARPGSNSPASVRTAASRTSRGDRAAGQRRLLVEVLAQRPRDPGHLVAAGQPGVGQRLQHLAERRLPVPRRVREVGAGEERVAVVVEHAGHRPAAVPGHRRGRLHVDRVDVRPLLAVHLDADEVLVEVRRGRLVLERLVRHHVAPVARGVPDAQQHRHVAPPGLLERRRLPLPPVDGVVGVLEQVRRRRARQAVGGFHAAIVSDLALAGDGPGKAV